MIENEGKEIKNGLIITDVDGTLFDTSIVNYQAYKKAIEEITGYVISEEEYKTKMFGKYYKDYLPRILKECDGDLCEKIHDLKKIEYKNYLLFAKENIHLFRIIDALKEKYYCSIVTNACKDNTMDILEYFEKIDRFDLILTQEDVIKPKPDPEGFVKAIEYFHIEKKDSIIFEDANVGIEAAISAGANVMRIERGFI